MNGRTIKILYFIQLPPPVHGVSTVNSIVYNNPVIQEGLEKVLLEVRFSNSFPQLRRNTPGKFIRLFSLLTALKKTLKAEKPDCVYFSLMPVGKGFFRDILFVRILKRSNIKIIYHLHNRGIGNRSSRFPWCMLYRYVFSDSAIIHLSEGLIRSEIDPLHLQGIKTFAIPSGIPGIIPRSSVTKEPEFTLLLLSNFFPGKGIYDAVKILSLVHKKHPEVKLRFAGEFLRKKYKVKLERMISSMGLNDAVTLTGPRYGNEKELEFQGADVFLFPSHFNQECMPLVLLEAMSCGLPIVSSRVGAIHEMIDNGKDGILVDSGDLNGFAQGITDLIEDPQKRQLLGLAARSKFQEIYTLEKFSINMRKAIEHILTNNE